jgi:hypothetical protein
MYQQIPTGTRLVYVATHVCTQPVYTTTYVCTCHVYTAPCVCVWNLYIAFSVHLHKVRVLTFLKLISFVASVPSTCNIPQSALINLYQSTRIINHVHQTLTQPVPSQVHQLCTSQYLITITKTKICFY